MNTNAKKLIVITGYFTGFSFFILSVAMFYAAVYNGGSVLFSINKYGEEWILAFVIFPILLIVVCLSCYFFVNSGDKKAPH